MSADGGVGVKLKIPNFEFEAFVNDASFDQEHEQKSLDIEKAGQDDGLNNIPSKDSGAQHLTSAEQKIFDHCKNRLYWLGKETSRVLGFVNDRLQQSYMDLADPDFDKIRRNSKLKIEELKHVEKGNLTDIRKDERLNYRYLTYFKRANKIKRAAEYPESVYLTVGILVSAIVAESAMNAYFFAEASAYGFIGGVWQAALISFVNVMLSVALGFFAYRGVYDRNPIRKLASILGIIFHVVFAVLLNLAAAHYRDLIEIDPDVAMSQTFISLRENYFDIRTLDAALLFVLGLVIALIATWEGFTLDDRVPGYGAADRRYRASKKIYRKTRNSLIKKASSSFTSAFDEIDDLVDERVRQVTLANEWYSGLVTIHGVFMSSQSQLNDILKSMLVIYRQENMAVRSETPPTYFHSYYPPLSLDGSFNLPKPGDHRKKIEELNDSTEQLKKSASVVKKELQETISKLREDMDALIEQAEYSAIKEIDKDEDEMQ